MLLLQFIILNILNVVIQTVKSIITIKGGKMVAAVTNAIAYGFYTIVIVYMMCDLPLIQKALIVGVCNLIGVFIVKLIEEKTKKDKLWKVELTVDNKFSDILDTKLRRIPHSYIPVGNHTLFNFYCATQADTKTVTNIAKRYNAKFFAAKCENIAGI